MLRWAREEIRPKQNQYGGEPGASSAQLLVETLDYVTTALEDSRAGVVLSALDFSKAFNRFDHGKCLTSIIEKGISRQVLDLLAAFLHQRTMTIKVGKCKFNPRTINAEAPQGSVLGCFLFNLGVDNLEDEFVNTGDQSILDSDGRETLS